MGLVAPSKDIAQFLKQGLWGTVRSGRVLFVIYLYIKTLYLKLIFKHLIFHNNKS